MQSLLTTDELTELLVVAKAAVQRCHENADSAHLEQRFHVSRELRDRANLLETACGKIRGELKTRFLQESGVY